MATFLPASPLCDQWEMAAEILIDETATELRRFELDHTEGLESHHSAGQRYDSDLEQTLSRKWERANQSNGFERQTDRK